MRAFRMLLLAVMALVTLPVAAPSLSLRPLLEDELVAIKGVGKWTAETFLMFCEGRLDVFPGGDVALQEAMRWADQATLRPTEKQAYARAEVSKLERQAQTPAELLRAARARLSEAERQVNDHASP